jgi:predicted metal-dependent hydrolase
MIGLIERFFKPKISAALQPLTVEANGQPVSITMRKNARARRMTLRMGRDGLSATITVPPRVSRKDAESFALRSTGWIEKQLAKRHPTVPAIDGAHIPFRGSTCRIVATGMSRGLVRHDAVDNTIHVPGRPEHLARRLRDWLKTQAHNDLSAASQRYAALMDAQYRKISVRDQTSRWGSCSSSGDLSYSWRLVLAPEYVLDYVAAHEVAHLREMNHGPRFWRLVLTHCKRARDAKIWLKAHGQTLHSVVPQ